MIGEAIQAELFKLGRNRWSTFWAYGFVPIFALITGILGEIFIREVFHRLPVQNTVDPVGSVIGGFFALNDAMRIFPIAGAAILFAGEYRWETWRAILPRNDRASIMLAKLAVFTLAAAASIALCGFARLLVSLFEVGVLQTEARHITTSAPDIALGLLLAYGGALLQLVTTGTIVMLLAVGSRGMMASIIGSFILLSALEILTLYLRLNPPDPEVLLALLPNVAGSALRDQAGALAGSAPTFNIQSLIPTNNTQFALPGAGALAFWLVLLVTGAIQLFRRQDLSKE